MTFAEYQADVRRTYNTSAGDGVMQCALGLCGEAGEVADHIKKHLHHKHPLDVPAVTEELGDVLFYIVGMAHEIGTTLEAVAEANVAKRKERYPDGFDPQRSRSRYPVGTVHGVPDGRTYYGTAPAPDDAVNRALGHLHYRRDPDEWLAARRKRRAGR